MTPEELKEIKDRADKATPGPWSMEHCDYALGSQLDDEFIAHAREDIPKLIDEVEKLRKLLKDMPEERRHQFAIDSGRYELQQENARLREALKFYALKQRYYFINDATSGFVEDKGRRARAALGEGEK